MIEIELLGMCTVDDAVILYRNMIEEYRKTDRRLAEIPTDDKSLRTMASYSLDTENCLFFILRKGGKPAGFIDSARVSADVERWFIKAVWLERELRTPKVFHELLAHLERYVKKTGIDTIFTTALLDDPAADDLWADAGYAREGNRRIKTLR